MSSEAEPLNPENASPRSSTSSNSFAIGSPSGRHSPVSAIDSSTALILVHDNEEQDEPEIHDAEMFEFTSHSDDEDELQEHEDEIQLERLRSSAVPPMSSASIFLYLLTPLLKLGAILIVDESGDGTGGVAGVSLKTGLVALILFALLCGLSRQVWYIVARYVRKVDMEEVLLETFAKGRGREKTRSFIRSTVRFATGFLRILMAVVYLRACVDVLLPLISLPSAVPERAVITLLLSLLISPLCFAKSLASTPILWTSWLSIFTFIAWLTASGYAHAKGILSVNPTGDSLGVLWQGISVFTFAFTTSCTLPLYASLRGTVQPGGPKSKRSRSFKLLSAISVALASLLIVPLIFFRSIIPPSPSQSATFKILLAGLNITTLAFTIPLFIITTSALPIPLSIRRNTNFPVSKAIMWITCIILALVPRNIARILSDLTLVLAFLGTYVVPAIIHITIFNFRRPLTIVIPPSTPVTPLTSSSPHHLHPSDSRNDELLQRKERTLQRRRLGKRLIWDIGVWVLLVPIGGGGLAWAGGRILGKW
ncbi:hypothetical protein C8Q75DRAFT_777550 [Abortiporus biennis]|nr:hypothetical protein C8Q75DRAFT_777550 [Abortiporus biennis]